MRSKFNGRQIKCSTQINDDWEDVSPRAKFTIGDRQFVFVYLFFLGEEIAHRKLNIIIVEQFAIDFRFSLRDRGVTTIKISSTTD